MDNTYEIGRGGGLTTIRIKDHAYDVVEFTVKKFLADEREGKPPIVDSGYTVFFSNREFNDFFAPIVNDLKERIENEQRSSDQSNG
jgi:hypothetical protein